MEKAELERLLSEYATGGLSEAEKQKLFQAALSDQDLFDQLMEEDSLREAIEMPGARNRLIDSLQEETVDATIAMQPSAYRSGPKRVPPRQPLWLAWVAGICIVLVSGAISYIAFQRPVANETAVVFSEPRKAPKEFVPPPPVVAQPRAVTVEAPPKIVAEARPTAGVPMPVAIPLPSAPPPQAAPERENKMADATVATRAERDLAPAEFRARQSAPAAAPAPAGPVADVRGGGAARRESTSDALALGSVSKAASGEDRAKTAIASPSLWRRSGDGIWVRVPAGMLINREDTVVIRHTSSSSVPVSLLDAGGRRLVRRSGRRGEELELPVPHTVLQRAMGDSTTLLLTEGSQTIPIKILFAAQ